MSISDCGSDITIIDSVFSNDEIIDELLDCYKWEKLPSKDEIECRYSELDDGRYIFVFYEPNYESSCKRCNAYLFITSSNLYSILYYDNLIINDNDDLSDEYCGILDRKAEDDDFMNNKAKELFNSLYGGEFTGEINLEEFNKDERDNLRSVLYLVFREKM